MFFENKIWAAAVPYKENENNTGNTGEKLCILPAMANRHGLIAGSTGSGKTISLKVLAESFSDAGVSVMLADVKGDLAGMCEKGEDSSDINERVHKLKLDEAGFSYKAFPVRFWDVYAQSGLALRTTVTEFGPLLLSRLLELNQIQSDILNIVFQIADDEGLLLIDIKDLKAMLNYVSQNSKRYVQDYGNISSQSINAIIRSLAVLEQRGGDMFFAEPALDIEDWFKTDENSRGFINILDSSSLINDSLTYSTFMLWLLSEFFEKLPEAGDLKKPKMVLFFDEAHLLFKDIPKALMQKIEQVMKLIRSKGIGVYFISQSPKDIPDEILAQLGNKIQHSLRAYTPAEQKVLKAAAASYRANPGFDTFKSISELAVGEALVSFIEADGSPSVVSRAYILPPQSKIGTVDSQLRKSIIDSDILNKKYFQTFDRDSAYEFLCRLNADEQQEQLLYAAKKEADKLNEKEDAAEKKRKEQEEKKLKRNIAGVGTSALGTIGREIGKDLGSSVGGKFGKRLGGNVGASFARGLFKTLFKI